MTASPLFCTPLRSERFAVLRGAGQSEVMLIGKGHSAARAFAARLRDEDSDRPLVLIGVAGALGTDLRAGDLVVASSVATLDDEPEVLSSADEVTALLGRARLSVRSGPIVTADKIVRTPSDRAAFGGAGIAVDMESFWCAELARSHPFAVVRAIVDTPKRDLFSPGVVADGIRGLAALSSAARALRAWAPVANPMQSLMEASDR